MKKFFSGIIIGVLLMLPFYAFADQISMIGKKIQGEYPVFLNGDKLEVNAPVLDGTSFLPVRTIGEALNLVVDFDDEKGEIILTDQPNEIIETEEELSLGYIESEIRRHEDMLITVNSGLQVLEGMPIIEKLEKEKLDVEEGLEYWKNKKKELYPEK